MTSARLHVVSAVTAGADVGQETLDQVFAALSDPVRRSILMHLEGRDLLVSQIAGNFDISLQAVSKHIQVLVRAGLVAQERTGRVSRCRLDAGPIYSAAVWLNRYSTYWQAQFDFLAGALADIDERRRATTRHPSRPPTGRRRKRKSVK